jgi:malonate transporter and related proteins
MRSRRSFAIPCLLFSAIATLDLSAAVFRPALLGLLHRRGHGLPRCGLLGARFLFGRPWEDAVAVGFCCLFSNSVMLGLPLTERAYGAATLASNFVIVALHAPFCYLVGVTAMEAVRNRAAACSRPIGQGRAGRWRQRADDRHRLGFLGQFLGLAVPGAVEDALGFMVRAALPAALFALGGVLCRYRPEGDLRLIGYVCAVSLVLHPAMTYTLGMVLGLGVEPAARGGGDGGDGAGDQRLHLRQPLRRAMRVAASSVLLGTALTRS